MKRISGFRRCPRCGTMQGPVPMCTHVYPDGHVCGWGVGCAHCKLRVWVPGAGWTLSHAYPEMISHGMCPWCAVRAYGGDPKVVSYAAERLGVPAGMLMVTSRRMRGGARYISVGYGGKTGWAGKATPPDTDTDV